MNYAKEEEEHMIGVVCSPANVCILEVMRAGGEKPKEERMHTDIFLSLTIYVDSNWLQFPNETTRIKMKFITKNQN